MVVIYIHLTPALQSKIKTNITAKKRRKEQLP